MGQTSFEVDQSLGSEEDEQLTRLTTQTTEKTLIKENL